MAQDDPYKVLGVARTASDEEIRKAYRRLAKKHHPDLNPGDRKAEDRFKEASAAYDILGDPARRARYDRGEIDSSGAQRPPRPDFGDFAEAAGPRTAGFGRRGAGGHPFGNLDDLFADLFGRTGGPGGGMGGGPGVRGPGADVRYRVHVDFLDAVNGARRRLTMPDGRALDVAIPAGVQSGQVLRLKGQGLPGATGGAAGDAFLEIEVAPHPTFERRGTDIHSDLPVSLPEAVLGAKVTAPTVSGPVSLSIPAGASSGKVLRLKGRGVPDSATGRPGDHYVTVRIVLPDRRDPELERLVADWASRHSYTPRR